VIIRGYGFAAVSSGLLVDFGGTAATSASFVSDTEIHATYPALVAGSYAVHVGNGGPALPTRARLVVVDAPAFPAATILRTLDSLGVDNLIYDAERRAIYLMDGNINRIERYRFNGSNWLADSLVTGGGNHTPRIALSPDGTELLKTSGGGTISRIDPATLSVISTVTATAFPGTVSLGLIAFANDGGAIGTANISPYRYDMLTQQFTALNADLDLSAPAIVASGNGDTLLLASSGIGLATSSAKPVFAYDSSSGNFTQTIVRATSERASLSRDGSRIILVSLQPSGLPAVTVYDASFTALGTLPAVAIISPDATTAYGFGTGMIRKFDLNSPSGGSFLEIGSGTPLPPGASFTEMIISPDGRTLFLAGDRQLVVVPAP
jgi:dipeptidyl aminopeptidase/acylaminoacyl peptidase